VWEFHSVKRERTRYSQGVAVCHSPRLFALGVAGEAGEIGDSDGEIGPLAGEIGDLRLERGDASGAGSESGREGVVDGRAVGGFHLGDSLIALEWVHLRRQQ
jgi:hypothetical protein